MEYSEENLTAEEAGEISDNVDFVEICTKRINRRIRERAAHGYRAATSEVRFPNNWGRQKTAEAAEKVVEHFDAAGFVARTEVSERGTYAVFTVEWPAGVLE